MGVYGPITYADLKIINTIRNSFAHPRDDNSGQLECFDFNHKDIADECDKLEFLKHCWSTKHGPCPASNRDKYIQTARTIAVKLWSIHVVPRTIGGPELVVRMDPDKLMLP
jgi:hypothetical protein